MQPPPVLFHPPLEDTAVLLPVPACTVLLQLQSSLPGSTVSLSRYWERSLVLLLVSAGLLGMTVLEQLPIRARWHPQSYALYLTSLHLQKTCLMTAACPARTKYRSTQTLSKAAAYGWMTLFQTSACSAAVHIMTTVRFLGNLVSVRPARGRAQSLWPGMNQPWMCLMLTVLKLHTLYFHNLAQKGKAVSKGGETKLQLL